MVGSNNLENLKNRLPYVRLLSLEHRYFRSICLSLDSIVDSKDPNPELGDLASEIYLFRSWDFGESFGIYFHFFNTVDLKLLGWYFDFLGIRVT